MDWKTLIADLQAAGISQTDIGVALSEGRREKVISQAWVSAVANGKYNDLKWSDGQALIALHEAKVRFGRKAKRAA